MRRRYLPTILLSSILLLPIFTVPVNSTTAVLTQRTWGGSQYDVGNSVAVDSSGNIYVTGSTNSFGAGSPTYSDVILIKYDTLGSLVWQRTWGGSNTYEAGQGVATDQSGSVYVTGITGTGVLGSVDIILLKFDSSGTLLWQRTWGGGGGEDQTGGIVVDASGNVYVGGYAGSFGAGGDDVAILKLDSSGNLVWQKTWGTAAEDRGWSIALDSAGSVYVTGTTYTGNRDVVILKLDSSGNLVWHRMWGGSGNNDFGRSIAVDSSGSIYATGGVGGDVFLLKLDFAANLLWQRTWQTSGSDFGYSVALDSLGSIYVAGSTDGLGAGLVDTLLLKFDSSGALVWQKLWGGTNNDYALGVDIDSDGAAIVTGYVNEAQPYTLSSPTVPLNSPTFLAGPTGVNTLMTPAFALGTPANSPGTPTGSQSYGGSNDVFLLRYGDLPRITFRTSPGVGSITFNGFAYTDGQNGNYSAGEFTATAIVPPGYRFSSWNATGGIAVASATSNPTTVTVTGPGTLTANFTPSALGVLENPLVLASIVGIIAAVAAIGLYLLRKRKTPTTTK